MTLFGIPPRRARARIGARRLAALFLVLGSAAPAIADAAEQPDIVVTANIELVQALAERSLDSDEVETYGAGSVGELLTEIAAEDGENRDDAAFLINGERVPGIGSVADLPAEAIVRIDVLPRGSGPKVGAAASQRVYNIQLRRRLDLRSAGAGARAATRGGSMSRHGDLRYTYIRGQRHVNLSVTARDESVLLESERGIVQPPGTPPDAGRFRSLAGATDRLDFSLSAMDHLAPRLSAMFVGRLSFSRRHVLLGPFGLAPDPLDQNGRTVSGNMNLFLHRDIGRWQLSLSGDWSRRVGRVATERAGAGPTPLLERTRSTGEGLGTSVSAFGPFLELPAGPIVLNLSAGARRDTLRSFRAFAGTETRHPTTLNSTTVTASAEIPLASKGKGALSVLGDLSATLEFTRRRTSGFGSDSSYMLGFQWRPTDALTFNGSVGRMSSPPPITSLDEPIVETPGFRYFDPLRGETIDIVRITGGSLSLPGQRDETRRLSGAWNPFSKLALRVTGEYFETRNRNLISELPSPTTEIFSLFPQNFIRDANDRLIAVDARPVFFHKRVQREWRTGLSLNLPLGKARPGARLAGDEDEGAAKAAGARPSLRPRLNFHLSHVWLLRSELTIRSGQPGIDLLSQDAVGLGGLGQPRHRFDAGVGYAERGLGVRATAQSRSSSFIAASGATPNVLRFEPLATFTLRAWVQGERLAPGSLWLKGTRFSLSVLNLADAREKVRDRFGTTPLAYQAAYRDPLGRSIELEFRKKF